MSKTTSILDKAILSAASTYGEAHAAYEQAFHTFLRAVPPLAPEYFWRMMAAFVLLVRREVVEGRENPAQRAADEFLRQCVVGDLDYGVEAGVHFAISWRYYRAKASASGDKAPFHWNRGDDGYGDLMDAVPLLGREFNERLERAEFRSLIEFSDAALDECVLLAEVLAIEPSKKQRVVKRLHDLILHGENYFAMNLEDEAQKRLVCVARHGTR